MVRVEVDRNGLQVLDRDACLHLLATAPLGRVGVSSGALPMVLPVNFHVADERILIRSTAGSRLDAALRNAVVAFEADDFDPIYHSGWSVLVTGVARVVDDPDELQSLRSVPLARWAPAGDDHLLAISTEMVSGRRLCRF